MPVSYTHLDVYKRQRPALCRTFAGLGARVIADDRPLLDPEAPAQAIQDAEPLDALVANLALPAPFTAAISVSDEEWRHVFAHLVDPLPRLVRAALPGMIQRGAGKILLMGSAAALRGMKRASTYSCLLYTSRCV